MNELTIGVAATILGACVTYVVGLRGTAGGGVPVSLICSKTSRVLAAMTQVLRMVPVSVPVVWPSPASSLPGGTTLPVSAGRDIT